jgi:protein-S-isoprenylcysteine O-methyltransferase Ste14
LQATAQPKSSPPKLDREHNLSYREPGQARATVGCVWRHYLASMVIYSALLALLLFNPWFRNLLQVSIGGLPAWRLYCYVYGAYALAAPIIFLILRPRSLWHSKNVMILGWLGRIGRHLLGHGFTRGNGAWRPSFKEKHAMVFLLIKLVYGPLMLNGIFIALPDISPLLTQFQQSPTWISRLDAAYAVFVALIWLLDSALFCFGYHTEAAFLKNEVRYVETTLSGLVVCLLCYPPFNMVTGAFLGPSNDDMNILYHGGLHHPFTWVLRGLAVLMLLLLTSASFSLFTKASNLTNRGIVQYGPYRWIRHPGYVGKNLFWLLTLVPVFLAVDVSNPAFPWKDHLGYCLARLGGFAGWCTIYVLRALTEERLLMKDPDYVEYCKKVRYRFIPGLC